MWHPPATPTPHVMGTVTVSPTPTYTSSIVLILVNRSPQVPAKSVLLTKNAMLTFPPVCPMLPILVVILTLSPLLAPCGGVTFTLSTRKSYLGSTHEKPDSSLFASLLSVNTS